MAANATSLTAAETDANVIYDLTIRDNNGTMVIDKAGLLAANSTDTQILLFSVPGGYLLELRTRRLITPDRNATDLARREDTLLSVNLKLAPNIYLKCCKQ